MKSVSNRKFTASRIAMIAVAAGVLGLVVVPAMSQLGGQGIFDIGIAKAQGQGSGQGGSGSGQGGQGSGQGGASSSGGGGSAKAGKIFRAPISTEEDSDRPAWAGVKGGKAGGGGKPPGAGTKKGDLFGDMVILLRDENGVPLLTDGLLQVAAFVYDEDGKLVPLLVDGKQVYIPYNEEGDLVTEIDGVAVYSVEVDLGRLSVGRSPTKVLEKSLADALTTLTTGTIGVDETGRLTVTVDGVTTTVDSPLSNLALYDAIMSGTIVLGVPYVVGDTTITLPTSLSAAALLAAASDKTGTITVDTVVYMNSILAINDLPEYYDFSSVDYDRSTTWENVTVEVLVLQDDGVTYKVEDVNVYDTLFNATEWTDPTAGGADDFAQAADDYLQVIEFVHDNAVR